MVSLAIPKGKSAYFVSDFHLGIDSHRQTSAERERQIIIWLDEIAPQTSHLFLIGDLFDFWFEYAKVVPKGFVRFQGKLCELCDSGIDVYLFSGNHDVWYFDYFTQEIGVKKIFRKPTAFSIQNRPFLIGHGDSLGKVSRMNRLMNFCFHRPFLQKCFGGLHPNLGIRLGEVLSKASRQRHRKFYKNFVYQVDNDLIYQYCLSIHKNCKHDYYIFGHTHYAHCQKVDNQAAYINTGTWLSSSSFGMFDGNTLKLFKDFALVSEI